MHTESMITLGDEDDLLDDIKEGVEIAMQRRGYDSEDIDPIKFNKLAYLAIQEYDVPITYGWYKYGPAPANVAHQSITVRPRALDEVPAVEEPRVQSVNHDYLSPEEYSYYFSDDLEKFENILETPTKEFLVQFYFDYAPDRYRDLYVASAELQQTLDRIKADKSWHDEKEEYVILLTERFPRAIHEIESNTLLYESLESMKNYEQLLMNVVTAASDQDELSESQQRFIKRVVDYFYGGAWNYVALLISRDTVELSPGENKSKLRNSIGENLRELRNQFDTELSRLEERAEQFDLISESPGELHAGTIQNSEDEFEWEEFDEENTTSMQEMMQKLE